MNSRSARCRPLILALAALALTTTLGGAQPPVPDDTLRRLMAAGGIPGLAMAAVRDGAVASTAALGVASVETGEPVREGTVFEAASLSKPVFTYAVLRLADRGVLDLDAPLWSLLPYARLEHDERAHAITPRMVLTHTSGLPNWGGTPLALAHEPGQRWSYSGEGFVFLQRALEEKTGLTLDELVRREVFEPLGMVQSSFVWRADYDTTAATGHDLTGEPGPKREPTDGNAAASLHTTATDYGRFLAAVLRGEGLDVRTWREMLTGHVGVRTWEEGRPVAGVEWGLGWGIQHGERGKAIWHWGDNGRFRCFVIGYPERKDGLVYFTNSENGLAIVEDLLSKLFPDTHLSARFLPYLRHDDPRQIARLELRRAFLADPDSGLAVYRSLSTRHPDAVEGELDDLVQVLVARDRAEAALVVAREAATSQPRSAAALVRLGYARTAVRRYEDALEAYVRAFNLGPEDAENVERRMEWLRLGLDSEGSAAPTEAELRRYAGDYGPRHISLSDGELYYERDGGTSRTRLIPLTNVVFELESSAVFRIRFVEDEEGRVKKIVGLYADGRTDETPRTE